MSLWCGMQPFVVAWRVAGQNFEEILQHLITPQVEGNKKFMVQMVYK